jgi:hypothetical protein
VVAVDPGDLAPEVLRLPGVFHVRARSEAAGARVAEIMTADGDGGGSGATAADGRSVGADVLVSDMNIYPAKAVEVSDLIRYVIKT